MLRDFDIRQALIKDLEKTNQRHVNPSYKIIEELNVCDGDARIDIAVALAAVLKAVLAILNFLFIILHSPKPYIYAYAHGSVKVQ